MTPESTLIRPNPEGQRQLHEVKERVRGIPVAVIIPPSEFLADERVFPSLGPLKVAAALEQNGNPVDVLDLSGCNNYQDIVRAYAASTSITHFGLTATSPQMPAAIRVRDVIFDTVENASVILGGPHVTLCHTALVSDQRAGRYGRGSEAYAMLARSFHRLVVGDGEMAVFCALDPLNGDQVVDAGNLSSPLYMQKGTLGDYPPPARHLIDHDSYHYQIDGKRAFSVIGQLGCPFECGFCGGRASHVFRVARTRSPEEVVSEIENVVRESERGGNPYRAVMFYDDELNVVPTSLERLCNGLIGLQERLGVEMAFRGFAKAERFNQTQARLMRQAGFRKVLSGFESGHDDILLSMGKHATRDDNTRFIEVAHNAGLEVKALMSIGHPGESEATISSSVEWVLENRPDDVDWTVITEYPGSPYFDESVFVPEAQAWLYTDHRSGRRLWSKAVDFTQKAEYYKGVPGEYEAFVWTDHLSSADLVRLRDQAEKVTRNALGLPEITSVSAMQFEHSMGQSLPPHILRSSRRD